MKLINMFWDWLDKRAIVRRTSLLSAVWMAWQSYQWAAQYAATFAPIAYAHNEGMGMAAVIGAVLAPVTLLVTSMFKAYSNTLPTNTPTDEETTK